MSEFLVLVGCGFSVTLSSDAAGLLPGRFTAAGSFPRDSMDCADLANPFHV